MTGRKKPKNPKAGKVYIGEVTFKSGEKKLYTGQTARSVRERVGEHMQAQNTGNTKSFTGKGVSFELKGSIFSQNRFKAEKTIKKMSPAKKRSIAKGGARQFRRKK